MIISNLDSTIQYPETNTLDVDDIEFEAQLYQTHVLDRTMVIALGKPKYTYIDQSDPSKKNVIYYLVYCIVRDKVYAQIGLYEIEMEKQYEMLDEDGDMDVDNMNPLRLYSFVTSDYLNAMTSLKPLSSPNTSTVENIPETTIEPIPISLQDEMEQSLKETKAYKKISAKNWIERFMHNNNYSIVENEGGGECLFASIRDGLKTIGTMVTVNELRDILAKECTEEVFQNYLFLYRTIQSNLHASLKEIKQYAKEYKEITRRIKATKDREILLSLTKQAEGLNISHTTAKKAYANETEMSKEYQFMAGVNSLDAFISKIKTCEFWGDTWAISTLERALNIKFILFSSDQYTSKDMDNVILCGQLNDPILQKAGVFNPEHYILLEYSGSHYRVITYKNRGALTFKELSYEVKVKIMEKCMERLAGPFYIIPEFKEFMNTMKKRIPSPDTSIMDTAVFQFYHKSADKPAPGKGVGEKLDNEASLDFIELKTIPHWRRKLDNSWISPFELDDHRWNSIEHYYQASKFKENNPHFYLKFALDANPKEDMAKDPFLAKEAGSKLGKHKGERLRPTEIKIDPNFYSGRHKVILKKALLAKFNQNPELKQTLLATKNALLNQFVKASEPNPYEELMEIRKELR
jgi:predicted NAD-dependent protein-ADP-ribosyltransferase YbiA (DUF1768 family)